VRRYLALWTELLRISWRQAPGPSFDQRDDPLDRKLGRHPGGRGGVEQLKADGNDGLLEVGGVFRQLLKSDDRTLEVAVRHIVQF